MTIDAQDAATTDIDQQIAAELAKESATLETETQVEATQTDDSTQVSEQVDTEGSEYVETDSDKVQKRINKKHFEMMEERRRADALQAQLDEMRANQAQQLPVQATEGGEPTLDQFKEEDYNYDDTARLAAYTQALTDYRVNEALSTRESKLAEQQQAYEAQRKQEELTNSYLDQAAEYSAQNPSYLEDVANLPSLTQDKLDLVRAQGPKMVHYLSKNPEAASQFANSDFGSAAVQLGMIASQISTKPTTTQVSKAPAPVETVQGNAGGIQKDLSDMKMEEIMALPAF